MFDASRVVMAVHQNHDYGYHPDGEKGVWEGEEAQENDRVMRAKGGYQTLENAAYVLTPRGLRKNYKERYVVARREVVAGFYRVWFALLGVTRPIRRRLGLGATARR